MKINRNPPTFIKIHIYIHVKSYKENKRTQGTEKRERLKKQKDVNTLVGF